MHSDGPGVTHLEASDLYTPRWVLLTNETGRGLQTPHQSQDGVKTHALVLLLSTITEIRTKTKSN